MPTITNPLERAALRIAVDDRERCPDVVSALRKMKDVHVNFERLSLGDYSVDKRLLVERKTIHDFALSVMSGRIFRQASRLSSCSHARACFVLEGSDSDFAHTAISNEAFQGAVITVTLVFGLPLLRSHSPEETAQLILTASRQLARRVKGIPKRRSQRISSKRRLQVLLLQCVPDLGPVKALALLRSFGSLERVIAATYDELAAVPGVGSKTAARLRWLLS
jgi:ERCC4-type nuclease